MKNILVIITAAVFIFSGCSGFRPFEDEKALKIFIRDSSQLVMGRESWDGPVDCSAHGYLNETASGLLFTIEVFDDSLRMGNAESYLNDGVELYFDFRPPRLRENNFYERGVFQAVILPDPGKKQIAPIEWWPKNYDSDIPGTRAYTELRDSGYIVQFSIPYSSLKRNHYWPRQRFYMDVAINDADTGSRESQMMWAGFSDNWDNPHNFREVSFEKEEKESTPPNILLILTSQLTRDALSAYGNPYLNTPYMDALAKYGWRFNKSYTTSPASSPARSSIITGRMPHQTGVLYNDQTPDSSMKNVGQMLSEAGYETRWAGKWHLPAEYPHTDTSKIKGFRLIDFLEEEKTSARGDDTDPPLAEAVTKYIKGRKREPFFLVASFQNPHDISALPIKPDAFPRPANMESTPPLPPNHRTSLYEPEFIQDERTRNSYENEIFFTSYFGEEDWKNYLFHYYRQIEKLDENIGKIIKALESQGLDENTLIILTSDHGEGSASHQWAGTLSLYEESVSVPLVFCNFGKIRQSHENSRNLVSGLDITPTILDYAGIEPSSRILGRSLRAIIENPDTAWRRILVTELAIDPKDESKTARMVTNGRYKYMIYSYGKRNEQLFDLENDPGEMRNLAYNSSYSNQKKILKNYLREWAEYTGDPFLRFLE